MKQIIQYTLYLVSTIYIDHSITSIVFSFFLQTIIFTYTYVQDRFSQHLSFPLRTQLVKSGIVKSRLLRNASEKLVSISLRPSQQSREKALSTMCLQHTFLEIVSVGFIHDILQWFHHVSDELITHWLVPNLRVLRAAFPRIL